MPFLVLGCRAYAGDDVGASLACPMLIAHGRPDQGFVSKVGNYDS